MSGTATDRAGENSSTSVALNIDETAPELLVQFDVARKDVHVIRRDGLSGVAPGTIVPFSISPPPGRRENDDDDDDGHMERRTYRVTDLAGNALTIVLKVKRDGSELRARIISWTYQNGPNGGNLPLSDAPANRFDLDWRTSRDGSLRELEQSLSVNSGRNRQDVEANYNSVRNETTIRVDNSPRIVRPGLVLLKLTTNRGTLGIEY